jgi:predicted cobalt transporter CbtA
LEDSHVPLSSWVTNLTNLIAANFGPALFGVALLMTSVFFLTGNRENGKAWIVGGLIGFGIMMAIPSLVAWVPRPS